MTVRNCGEDNDRIVMVLVEGADPGEVAVEMATAMNQMAKRGRKVAWVIRARYALGAATITPADNQ